MEQTGVGIPFPPLLQADQPPCFSFEDVHATAAKYGAPGNDLAILFPSPKKAEKNANVDFIRVTKTVEKDSKGSQKEMSTTVVFEEISESDVLALSVDELIARLKNKSKRNVNGHHSHGTIHLKGGDADLDVRQRHAVELKLRYAILLFFFFLFFFFYQFRKRFHIFCRLLPAILETFLISSVC